MLLSRLEWAVVHFERGRLGDHREAVSSLASLEHGQLGEKEPFLTVHEPETKSSLVYHGHKEAATPGHMTGEKFRSGCKIRRFYSPFFVCFLLFFFFKLS